MLGSGKIQTKLDWEGKRTEVERVVLPFQLVEVVNEPRAKTMDMFVPRVGGDKWYNMLVWGDNKLLMNSLIGRGFAGKINLIYIDPPFATGANFTLNIKVENEEMMKEASAIEMKAYRDTWGQGLASYLQMMYDRLVLMHDLLTENGSIYAHLDARVGHYVKLLLDEIFGKENFRNEIIWKKTNSPKAQSIEFGNQHDSIYFYSKSEEFLRKPVHRETDKEYLRSFRSDDNDGRGPYQTVALIAGSSQRKGGRKVFEWRGVTAPWLYTYKNLEEMWAEGLVVKTKSGLYRKKVYLTDLPGPVVSDIWTDKDVSPLQGQSDEIIGYPTQKPEALLRRIIEASSNEGDLVADFFAGSGTTLAVAEKLRRRWIGADLSKFTINLSRKRLLEIPGCRPFQILNLGRYQKQKLMENGNGGKKYIDFILQLYKASPLQGFAYIHGKKSNRLVHIGGIDSFVTEREIREASRECLNVNAKGIDILGWDFEMGLHDLVDSIEREYGIDIHLTQIPLEVLEMKAHERSRLDDIKFFDLNYLDIAHEVKGREVKVYIKRFVIANPEYIPEEIRNSIKDYSSFIDYWAVDFDFKGDTFHNMRQEYRTKKNPKLPAQIKYEYDKPGEYDVLVKVVDILGNDTTKLLHIKVE